MRALILAIASVLCACSQTAPPSSSVAVATPEPAQKQVDCAGVSQLARSIMQARQVGASMEQSMAIAKDDAMIRSLVIKAYDEPHYATPEMQERAAGDFADQSMLACLKG